MAGWDGRGLVSTGWLASHLDDPGVRIFDATVHLRPAQPGPYRVESGRADYEAGHIPGAAFVDLARDLSDPSAPLGFTRLKGEALRAALGAAGIDPGLKIVCYSTSTPMWATRLWWVLRSAGFMDVAVLDGGFARWAAEGRAVESGTRTYPATEVRITERPDAWADRQDVLAAIDDDGVCTVNALPAGVHSGEADVNYGRKGHIKGSRNVPYAALLDADGLYRSDEDLRGLFEGVGALQRPRVIVYCGGGISATMDALALTRLGHPCVAVYDGSMSEWTRDPDLPMETGA